ncbi:hypothetical protein, partial [Rhizobium rhizogenes]|uniref:hypothetical protein n=1 Tax=Rhizobium rhizogenes TaxID=359 RepID=UPI001AEF237C
MAFRIKDLMVSVAPPHGAVGQDHPTVVLTAETDCGFSCGDTGIGTGCGTTDCVGTGCGASGCGATDCVGTGCGASGCGATDCVGTGCGASGCGA